MRREDEQVRTEHCPKAYSKQCGTQAEVNRDEHCRDEVGGERKTTAQHPAKRQPNQSGKCNAAYSNSILRGIAFESRVAQMVSAASATLDKYRSTVAMMAG